VVEIKVKVFVFIERTFYWTDRQQSEKGKGESKAQRGQ
jgi:hypothetical protein